MLIFVSNSNTPDWRIVTVQGTPDLNLSASRATQDTTTSTVKVTDFAGTGLSNKDVDPVLSTQDAWNVSVVAAAAGSNGTDATGIATFTVGTTASARTGQNATTVAVRFKVRNDASQVNDQVGILLYSSTSSGQYSAKLAISTCPMPALHPPMHATN